MAISGQTKFKTLGLSSFSAVEQTFVKYVIYLFTKACFKDSSTDLSNLDSVGVYMSEIRLREKTAPP